ncbi:hypothetical protein V6N12_002583 [Hibiscus sabdariffa]|uniref:Uncharacterized protein n=1 Tax=Hibiscus sabdariffa TaxID=183260 RepID=A0ABR2E9E2_9ROSI
MTLLVLNPFSHTRIWSLVLMKLTRMSNPPIDLDDGDTDLCGDDVSYDTINGVLTIDFSNRVQSLAIKKYGSHAHRQDPWLMDFV